MQKLRFNPERLVTEFLDREIAPLDRLVEEVLKKFQPEKKPCERVREEQKVLAAHF